MKLSPLILLLFTFLLPQASLAATTIGWIPTWQRGLEEAKQTGKPILLFSGAPNCSGVPGVW